MDPYQCEVMLGMSSFVFRLISNIEIYHIHPHDESPSLLWHIYINVRLCQICLVLSSD
jgi:hypothetical protein